MASGAPADLGAILAALQAQQQNSGTPGQPSQGTPQPPSGMQFSPSSSAQPPMNSAAGFQLPAPTQVGNLDLSKIQPSSTGHLDIQEALAKVTGNSRDYGGRPYSAQARERSRSPIRRDNFRDGHNPYRDERRDDSRRTNNRDRSRSPGRPSSGAGGRGADSGSETITVDSSAVGLIIGRAGENMRRIESESGARVQFITGPESSGPKRQCRISGSAKQREAAIRDIYMAAQQNQSKQSQQQGGRQSSTPNPANAANAREGEETDQIMVPDRTVGLIIGRGGETIRDLQERSGCHVNILGENRSVNGMRPVNLIGSDQAADKAKQMIYEIVESDTRGAPNSQAQPPRREPAPMPAAANPYGAYGGASYNPYPPAQNEKITDNTKVPSEAVGMIIGKGGETIKDMQNSSSCKINVHQPSGADIERSIELIGTPAAIEHAKRLIWDKVQTVREKQGGLTRGGPDAPPSYGADPYSRPLASTPTYGAPMQQHATMPPAQQGPPPTADPYAAYGGYQNYIAMWNAASAHYPQPGMPNQPQ